MASAVVATVDLYCHYWGSSLSVLDFFGSVDDEAGTAEGDEFDDIGEEPSLTKTKKPKTPKVKNGEKKGGGIIKNILLYLSVLLALGGVLGGGLYGY